MLSAVAPSWAGDSEPELMELRGTRVVLRFVADLGELVATAPKR